MTFYYEIGHGCEDGGSSIILMRDSEISYDDLRNWIGDAIVDILALYEKKGAKRGQYEFPRSVEYILDEIADWLVMNRGFKHIEIGAYWSTHSFASLFDKSDHHRADDDIDPITDRLIALGYSWKDDWMMVKHGGLARRGSKDDS